MPLFFLEIKKFSSYITAETNFNERAGEPCLWKNNL